MNQHEAFEEMKKVKTVQDNDFFHYYDLINDEDRQHYGDDEQILMFRKSYCEPISINNFLNFDDFMGHIGDFKVLSDDEQKELRGRL